MSKEFLKFMGFTPQLKQKDIELKASRAEKTGVLSLSNAGLKDVPEKFLQSAVYIKSLNLSRNKMEKMYSCFNSSPKNLDSSRFIILKTINLSSNNLKSLSLCFCQIKSIESLQLDNNNLESSGLSHIHELTNLKTLSITKNKLATVPETFSFLYLVELDLSDNVILELPESFGANMTSLEKLVLQNNNLRTLPIGLISCTSLLNLNLRNNKRFFEFPIQIFNTCLIVFNWENTSILLSKFQETNEYKSFVQRSKSKQDVLLYS